ncbi:hypothetical protein ACJMK2_027380 [Sinanodonta woodiana]|uniref:Uncharacterized protein n=1 Tax=Sinanodonta woodiana TaxID=1069815 RepID=A0ABD3XQY2_SINWO
MKHPENIRTVKIDILTDIATESPQYPIKSHLESNTQSLKNMESELQYDDCISQSVPNIHNSPNTPVRTLRGRAVRKLSRLNGLI